jgi:hypothetical protein
MRAFRVLNYSENLQTCWLLEDLTRSKALWVQLVRRLYRDHDIPSCSVLLDDMSVYQLERAALRPYLFERKIWSYDSSSVHQRVIRLRNDRTITNHSMRVDEIIPGATAHQLDPNVSNAAALSSIEIVPGGRYLIGISADGYLRCWDLGNPFQGTKAPITLVASIRTLSHYGFLLQERTVESASEVYVLVHPFHIE